MTQTESMETPADHESTIKTHVNPQLNAETLNVISTPSNVSIWGTVLQQPFKMLVDTGAAVTVVSERFFHDVLRIKYACTQKLLKLG